MVDYGHSSSVRVLAPIFNTLGCEVIALNSTMDESHYSRTADEFENDRKRLADITRTLHADMGIRIDTGGEKIFVVDDTGTPLNNSELLALMSDLIYRANPNATIVVPVTASANIEDIANQTKGQVKRVGTSSQVLATSALRDGVVLVGDTLGGFIFPSFHPSFDGMFSLAKLMELLSRFDVKISELVRTLPQYHQFRKFVDCPWDYKGRVMRMLSENYRESQAPDGVRIQTGADDWVIILPDADRPLFNVMAEARSQEQAQSLAERYSRVVTSFQM